MRPVLVLACLLGVGLTVNLEREPSPCESPPQMTGGYMFTMQKLDYVSIGRYVYDAVGKRLRMSLFAQVHNESTITDVLLLYDQGVRYEIDSIHSKCKKLHLQGEFETLGVPPNSSFYGQHVIGSSSKPGLGLPVNVWKGTTPKEADTTVIVTASSCIPVTTVSKVEVLGRVVMRFFDNVIGIEDPSELIPPSFCPSEDVQPEGKPVEFFSVMEKIHKSAR